MRNRNHRTILLGTLLVATALASSLDRPKAPNVTLYLSTDCPVVKASSQRIARLAHDFEPVGVRFEAVFPNEGEDTSVVEAFLSERGINVDHSLDIGGERAKRDGVKIIPTVIVRSGSGDVLYSGPIDDAKSTDRVQTEYVREAIESALNGKVIPRRTVEPFGCYLMAGPAIPSMEAVNYAEHVAESLNKHCVPCHRPGEAAPFSLVGYENARKWSKMLAKVTGERRMPPWKAAKGFGEFHDENRLSEAQIEIIKRWADAGAPRGDATKEPKPPTFPPGWAMGQPDLVLEMPEPFQVPAEGDDEYWHFIIEPKLTETKWIAGIDYKPGNRTVVHHMIGFIDDSGRSVKAAERLGDGSKYQSFGGPGFQPHNSLGGWAPGGRPMRLGDGAAVELKPGARIVIQVHYHKNGKSEVDQSRIGLYFADEPPKHKLNVAWLANPSIRLPAGESDIRFTQTVRIPSDVILYGVGPHMHMLGKSMKVTVEMPDKRIEPIIWIKDWDFNWQLPYQLKTPMLLPAGSKVHIEAVFDNSEGNVNNPNKPPKEVTWGEQTTDEMMLLVTVWARADGS